MNPPFKSNLHLKILQEALKHCSTVVNLGPDDFRYNLGTYINWSKDLDIRQLETHLVSSTPLTYKDGWNSFGLGKRLDGLSSLAVSVYSKDTKNKLRDVWKNEQLFKRLQREFCKNNLRKHFVRAEALGEFGQRVFRWHSYANLNYFDCIICKTGKAKEGIDFKTENERNNFVNSIHCWPYKLSVLHFKDINPAHLPFMDDYTQPWTDERFYKFFNLTDDEIKIVEAE